MFSRLSLFAIAGGLASGAAFCISAYAAESGQFLVYLAAYPLLLIGLTLGTKRTLIACGVALAIVALFADTGNALFFAAFTLLPVLYFIYKILLCRGEGIEREWLPVLGVLTELAGIAITFFLLFSIIFTANGHIGLQEIITRELAANMTSAGGPEVQEVMKWFTGEGAFFLFALTGWLWILMLYTFAALAHNMVAPHGLALRPSLALSPKGLPAWLLIILCVNGAMALMGSSSGRFIAETVFLMALLPYFLAGIAQIHQWQAQSRHRKMRLIIFYILLIMLPWLAGLVTAIGFYGQVAELLDKRRQIG